MFNLLVLFLIPVIVAVQFLPMKSSNLGHRLCDYEGNHYPENTLECLQQSLDDEIYKSKRFKSFEFDIIETLDNKLIVRHDREVQGYNVMKTSFDVLRSLRIEGCQMPMPEEVLGMIKIDVPITVEIKRIHSDIAKEHLFNITRGDNIRVVTFKRNFKKGFPFGCKIFKEIWQIGKSKKNLCEVKK